MTQQPSLQHTLRRRLDATRWYVAIQQAKSLTVIVYFLLAISLVVLAAVLMVKIPIPDFAQDYAAAWGVLHGYSPNTPTADLLAMCCPSLAPDDFKMQTAHPPAATLLVVPFAALPYPIAQWAWLMAGWAAIVGSWFILRLSPLVCFLTLPLWVGALNMGTLEPVIMLLLALSVRHAERPMVVGIALGSAIAFKIYPALLLVALVCGRRWRALGWTLAVTLALGLLAEGITGATRGWLNYMPFNTARWVDVTYNASLIRAIRAVLPTASPLFTAAGVALLLMLPLVPRLKSGDIRLLIPVMLLASPLVWAPYMGMLALRPIRNWQGMGLWCAGGLLLATGFALLGPDNLAPFVYGPLLAVVLAEWFATVRGDQGAGVPSAQD